MTRFTFASLDMWRMTHRKSAGHRVFRVSSPGWSRTAHDRSASGLVLDQRHFLRTTPSLPVSSPSAPLAPLGNALPFRRAPSASMN
jgi:hypothetical protein